MIAAAFAISLALVGPQSTPSTHDQAITCTGVFFLVSQGLTDLIKRSPSAESSERLEVAGLLFAAADADRLAAARREGLTIDRSIEIFEAWLEPNFANAQAVMDRDLRSCVARYQPAARLLQQANPAPTR